jgi:phosphatidylglycerophosphatase C
MERIALEPIAAFDVDGTLTRRDTFSVFLRRYAGNARLAVALGRRPGLALSTLSGRGDRDVLKAAVLRELLSGADHEVLVEAGDRHAGWIAERLLRPDAVERLRWHQAEGHHTVLVSASLRYYLEPLAARLGVDGVLCTEMEVGPDGRLTGELVGANCRGPEKARRLQVQYGDERRPAWAYGDSRGDRELLALADRPIWVTRQTLEPLPEASRG